MGVILRLLAKRRGYITIIALIGVVALGSVYYGSLLNIKWIRSSRASHVITESALASDFHAKYCRGAGERHFYKTDENIIWWTFLNRNISPLKEMLRFKSSVREFHKYTKNYVSDNFAAHTIGAGREIKAGNIYKRYMCEFTDTDSGIVWILPVFRDIPDSDRVVQDSYTDDGAAAFILPSGLNKAYYPYGGMTTREEIASHYSDLLGNPLFRRKFKFNMPFSQY